MLLLPILLHGAMVQGGGAGNWTSFAYGGKCVGPTCVAQKHGQVAAGRQSGNTWVDCVQKTS